MSVVYHYSPDLLQLLVDTIEVLCRSKRDVILFFRGAGVHGQVVDDLAEQVSRDPDSIKKREIAQPLLVLVNEGGDARTFRPAGLLNGWRLRDLWRRCASE